MHSDDQGDGLHIDGDWKTEAAQEKERLVAEERVPPEDGQAPAAGFLDLINMVAMQAAIGVGGFQGPGGDRIPPNLEVAKHHIDLLEVLSDKTKGNLTTDEKRVLDAVTHELRMQYVQAAGAGQTPEGAGGDVEPPAS